VQKISNANRAVKVKNNVTIQLSNPNNSALDNIALRTALSLQPLFIKFPLVANEATKRALMPLFLVKLNPKNKGIRARLITLSATKGNVINKGGNDKVCQGTKQIIQRSQRGGIWL
jgi:hypothetical protein